MCGRAICTVARPRMRPRRRAGRSRSTAWDRRGSSRRGRRSCIPRSIASASSPISSPAAAARMWAPTILRLTQTTTIRPSSVPSVRARSECARSMRQTSTSSPWRSVASAIVRPAWASSGSVNVAHGHEVVEAALAREEHVADRLDSLRGGRVGEQLAACEVADRVDGGDARARAVVDLDAARRDLDAERLEPEAVDVGPPPGGDEQLLAPPSARPRRGRPSCRPRPSRARPARRGAARRPRRAAVRRAGRRARARRVGARVGRCWSTVTVVPRRRKACDSSIAIGPPPMIASDAGARSISHTVSLVR